METLFEHAGGLDALHRLEDHFYSSALADPLLQPLFGSGKPDHVELYLAALDAVGMPGDEPFREAVRSHIEFGTKVAMQNSHAATEDELHPIREVPIWTWEADK